jgi:hypothetical protein
MFLAWLHADDGGRRLGGDRLLASSLRAGAARL